MIYRVTPMCFYLDGFNLECLKRCCTLFVCAQRPSSVLKTPGTPHVSFHSLPAGGYYLSRSYRFLLLPPSPNTTSHSRSPLALD